MNHPFRLTLALATVSLASLALVCPPPILDPSAGFALRARLEPGKTNVFRLRLDAGEFLTAAVEEDARGEFHDPVIGIFRPAATDPMEIVDDGGPGFLPRFGRLIDETGIWELVVTGREDASFDGSHGESFEYRMVITATASPEVESDDAGNDDPSGAEDVHVAPFAGANVVVGQLTPGDVDYYEVEIPGDQTVGASLFDGAAGEFNDSLVELGGATNDDGGPGFLSNLWVDSVATGRQTVQIKVTGFDPDPADSDGHPEDFEYRLVVSSRNP